MDKAAIDVALLPPDSVMDEVIKLNQTHNPIVNLNKTNRLPHITLVQAVVDISNLDEIKNKINNLAKSLERLNLTAKLVHNPDFYRIPREESILSLHEKAMEIVEPYATNDIQAKYYFDKDVRQKALIG
jgi:hypothetical protein